MSGTQRAFFPPLPRLPGGSSVRWRLARSLGSRYRWVIWGALAAINFNQNTQMYAASMLIPYLLSELDLSYTVAGTLLSAYNLSLALVITPIGMLGDRLGARRVLIAGQATMIVGALLFAAAQSFPIAFFSRIVSGIGGAAAVTTTGPLAAFWFSVRQFRVQHGVGTAVGKTGSVAVMWFLPALVGVIGWRAGYGIVSLTAPLALLTAVVFLASKPGELGLPPVQMFVEPSRSGAPDAARLGLWQVLRRPGVSALAVASFFYFGAYFGTVGWLPTYLANVLGLDNVTAGFQSGFVLWGTILGYGLTGPLANLAGRCRPLYTAGLLLSAAGIAVLTLGITLLPDWALSALLLLLGLFCSGLLFMTPMLAVLVPRTSLATASGVVFTTSYLGAVALPPLSGMVADATGSLAVALWPQAACGLLGALASRFIEEPAYPTQPPARP